jgi:hypothetical protein
VESSESIGPGLDSAATLPRVDPEGIWEVDSDDWAVGLKQSQFDDTVAPSAHDIFAGDGNVSSGSAVIECGEAQAFQQEEQQCLVKDVKNSDAAGSHPPPVNDARSILAEVFLTGDQSQSPPDAMDKEPCVVNCAVQSEDVLAVPELLECNGVYQGPCLLSQSSALG